MTGQERVADPFFGGSPKVGDPFPDPYTDFPVADILLLYCREHTSGLWGLGITISISAGAGRRSKAIKGIDGGQSI